MVRFSRSQIVDGISVVMLMFRRVIPVTAPLVQLIPGQLHGEDEEFHDWIDGGSSHCCFRPSRMACSVFWACEFTRKGMEMRRRIRRGRGVLRNGKGSLVILGGVIYSLRCSG